MRGSVNKYGCSALWVTVIGNKCQDVKMNRHAMYFIVLHWCKKYYSTVILQSLPELSSVHDGILFLYLIYYIFPIQQIKFYYYI